MSSVPAFPFSYGASPAGMNKGLLTSGELRRPAAGSGRPIRPWLWGLAAWLKNGSIAVAFYLALGTGSLGTVVLAAFIGGFFLRQVLEATSQGD